MIPSHALRGSQLVVNTSLTFGNMRKIAPPSPCPPLLRIPPTLGPKNQISTCSRNIAAAFTANCWTVTVNRKGKTTHRTHWTFSTHFHRLYPKAASFSSTQISNTHSGLLSRIPATYHRLFQTTALQTALKLLTPVIIHLHTSFPPPGLCSTPPYHET